MVRTSAAAAIATIGADASEAAPALVKLFGDPDAGVRATAAEAIGKIGATDAESIAALQELLHDTQTSVDSIVTPILTADWQAGR